MKIKYKYITGEVSEVEVSDEIGVEIMESRRIEENQVSKNKYHCYSLDGILYEGLEFASMETPEKTFEDKEFNKKLADAMSHLTDTQRRRLELLADGLTYREIAEAESTNPARIFKSVEQARKKIIKILNFF